MYVDLKNGIKKLKEGRKIAALKFCIKNNKKNTITPKLIEEMMCQDQEKLPLDEFEIENQQLLQTLLSEFGISNNKAIEILKTKDEFYIEDVLEAVKIQIKTGKIKDIPAFTVKAIEDDYRRKKTKTEIEQEKKQELKKQAQKEKVLLQKLEKEFNSQHKAKIDEVLNDLDSTKRKKLIREFEKDEIDSSNEILKNSYRKHGLDSHGNKALFRSYVAERLLPDEVNKFQIFAKKQGYEIVKRKNREYAFKK